MPIYITQVKVRLSAAMADNLNKYIADTLLKQSAVLEKALSVFFLSKNQEIEPLLLLDVRSNAVLEKRNVLYAFRLTDATFKKLNEYSVTHNNCSLSVICIQALSNLLKNP